MAHLLQLMNQYWYIIINQIDLTFGVVWYSWFSWRRDTLHPPLRDHAESFLQDDNLLWYTGSSRSTLTLVPLTFLLSVDPCFFLGCYITEIMKYTISSDWLLALASVYSCFLLCDFTAQFSYCFSVVWAIIYWRMPWLLLIFDNYNSNWYP